MYSYRTLSNEDLEAICMFPQSVEELLYVSPKFKFPLSPNQIIELLENRVEPTVIVQEYTGDLIAYANLYGIEEDTCWLGNVIVSPKYRGCGTAEVLLNVMINKAKEKYGIKKLLLSCHNTNSRGLAFYYKNGFKPCDIRITKLEDDKKKIAIQMELMIS
ncbi:GNAT family N-acetyltransferase [Paenibacillus selenitireducens]|uniref:GNAT family N-acetyltransferase n=1 Tax=Paenibacillus selenitireducens TaxID=1324314 RepID=A0A1T2X6F8_9BACL|nr:GNAT family N-acetyltransferase [Paenibacillus selenitireducens]